MTDVLVNLTRHTATGRVPAAGVLRWTPTRRVHIDAPTDGPTDEVVVPASFEIQVDGPTTVTVDPSGTSWAWTVHEATQGGRTIRTVAVPDSPTPVDYGDLVDIDPATLTPAAEPTAAWWAAHEALVEQLAGITVDPADIEAAVADYLAAHPVDAPVTSVNGEAGAVVLSAADVGADPAGTAQGLVDALVIPDPDLTGYVQTTDPRLTDARPPTAHAHPIGDVTGLQGALDGKQAAGSYAPASHGHTAGQVSGLATVAATGAYADLTGKPTLGTAAATASTDYAPASHGHPWSGITDKPAVIAAGADKAAARAAIGAGTSSLVIGPGAGDAKAGDYAPDLSGYVPTSRTVAGKPLSANIALSAADLTDHTEATQDVVGAMVTAAGGSYDDGAGTITLPAGGGTGAVDSVNGKTGAVVLTPGDVGADPAGTAASLVAGVSQPAGGLPRAMSAAVAALANVDVDPVVIVFEGDSLTHDGIQDANLAIWPGHLLKRLTHTYQPGVTPVPLVEDRATMTSRPTTPGIYGYNLSSPGSSADAYVTADDIAKVALLLPQIIFHCIGTNDFLGSRAPGVVGGHLRTAIANFDAACTVKPVHVIHWFGSMYQDKPYTADQYVTEFLAVAAEDPARRVVFDLGQYADTLGINDNISGDGDPYSLDGGDGIHLAARGYRMWGELLARAFLAAPPANMLGWSAPAPVSTDTTAPVWTATLTTGTPAQTSVVVAASALATDTNAITYEVSIDSGTTWAAIVPSGLNFTISGLTASTNYPAPIFRARDAAGNYSTPVLSAQSFTTAAPVADTTPPTPGTLASSAITDTGFTLTVSGASDAGSGLHAAPYAFSTDNGATWSAWQASAVLNVTGKAAETAYQCQHKVRDAAATPNEATGTAITVTTIATPTGPTPIADNFNRANSTTGLGTTDTGQTWTEIGTGVAGISSNTAYRVSGAPVTVVDFGQADMVVSYKVTLGSAYHGQVARCSDANNYYFLDYGGTGKAPKLRWKKAGAEEGAGGTFSVVNGDVVGLSVKTRGGGGVTCKIIINGTTVFTYDDTTSTLNGTKAGIYGLGASDARVDDFSIVAPA